MEKFCCWNNEETDMNHFEQYLYKNATDLHEGCVQAIHTYTKCDLIIYRKEPF